MHMKVNGQGRVICLFYKVFRLFLVPLFLFVASISLFSGKFTKKRAVILASSILPFYTIVATERICNKILPGSTEPVFVLKLITAIL